MTILQLQYAVECARRQSINQAAQALFVSTSNMSKAILALEGELGFPIFTRTPGGIRPTPKGEVFLQHARTVLVSDRGWKNELLMTTDCFTYGVYLPGEPIRGAYVSVPTDLSTFLVLALWVDKGDVYPPAAEFLELLAAEIQAPAAL